jgi:TPR repeat protein
MWGVAILAGIPLALCLLGPEYAYTLRLEGMIAFLVGGVVLGWHAHRMAKNLSVQTVGLRRRRASEVAFVLNFLFPGAGYVYAERMWGLAILIPWVILEAVVGLLDLAPASLSCRLIHCAIQILIDVVLGWHAYRLVMSRPEVSLSAMPPRVLARLTARTAFWVTVLGSLGLAYGATWAWAAFNTAGTVAPAAEQKLTALELGYKYEKGLGVDKNDSVAALWYRKAAEAGDADGMFRLGLMYWTGRGVSRDDAEGTRWIRKAADAGSSNGMFGLGAALSEGRGVSEDAKEGARWYEEAAKKGNAVGMRFTGIAYLSGNGVPQSDLVAAAWFRDAADAGDTDGMCGFAALLATGRGVSQNDLDAARWYLKAAQGGNPTAMLPLGEMYENGNGVPRDLNEAAKWYREAAKAGNPDAEERLRRVGSAGK